MNSSLPRCRITPLTDNQVSFEIDGRERLRWHFDEKYPRPFFYPLLGPFGLPLTRMGHPGAPNHDHHRSIWFAHEKVDGENFWSDQTDARVRQQEWLAYIDGELEAVMAVLLGWYGATGRHLMDQQLVAALKPADANGCLLELQSTFTPKADKLTLGRTNFGFLAVRVAKSISAHFGGGQINSSEGQTDEPAIFGQFARWMDYSGPIRKGQEVTTEGITYFDHPRNPGYPAHWHVREDGWMGASLCRMTDITLRRQSPLVLRYLLHAHAGAIDETYADAIADAFAGSPEYVVAKSTAKHQAFHIRRADANER